ncbi:fumarylacetoacetase [Streptomyces sp. PTM05]|uniref:fumarylacetoacetase n=1 Tax=Streptantibioticus parmotrematis TaxID=2873249 RepID=A0ABS7QN60_9ACTN|nr:fumarylacetoacetase [Streptantibioticus parmotrematis]MBY8883292.1 fumarylacetoacetase [Streptantibioticus parmotrematis]
MPTDIPQGAAERNPAGHDSPFGPLTLPYGVFSTADAPDLRRVGVRLHDRVLDASAAARALGADAEAALLGHPTLNPLLAAGRPAWDLVRDRLTEWLTDDRHHDAIEPFWLPLADVTLHLPFEVADYVDFYASEHHATRVGEIFRPGGAALTPNWKHLPIGYHGRAGSVVVSGTEVVRPFGQRKGPDDPAPVYGPSVRLDYEAEVGFVVGTPTAAGERVGLDAVEDHVFGVCLVNDWSARDIQAWEYVPLGPFLGKSFATSVSPWIVPLQAFSAARVAPPARDVALLPYLDDAKLPEWGLDLRLDVAINGQVVARPPFSRMYWTVAQQLAHLTVNGAVLRTGDLFASGTVSGPGDDQRGCLLESTWNGREPLTLPDGSTRGYLEDGDEVTIRAWAPGPDGGRVDLGAVTGRIAPAAG